MNRLTTTVFAAFTLILLFPSWAWCQDTWTEPWDGIQHRVHIYPGLDGRDVDVHAFYVDLCNPAVRVRMSNESDSKDYRVIELAKKMDATLAINADFHPSYGTTMTEGELWDKMDTYSSTHHNFLACSQDMQCSMHLAWPLSTPLDPLFYNIVSGAKMLALDGAPSLVCAGDNCRKLVARTAFGLSEDENTLILVVVEGGTSGNQYAGVGNEELGHLMVKLGAHTAINMDGSGSSVVVLKDPDTGEIREASDDPPGTRDPFNVLMVFHDASAAPYDPQSEKGLRCGLLPPADGGDNRIDGGLVDGGGGDWDNLDGLGDPEALVLGSSGPTWSGTSCQQSSSPTVFPVIGGWVIGVLAAGRRRVSRVRRISARRGNRGHSC